MAIVLHAPSGIWALSLQKGVSVVSSSDGFHIESHIDEVPALTRVNDLHGVVNGAAGVGQDCAIFAC